MARPTDDRVDQLNAALDGRYRIERTLGEGGMATVYLALDVRHERHVALKVLRPELSAVVGADRFLSEIQVTAKLQHPHILPLFDSGEANGILYFVMPFVEGESLRARLDRERQLAIDDVLTITAQVASALDYAHRQGIVHRDIKPANILMEDGSPVVADDYRRRKLDWGTDGYIYFTYQDGTLARVAAEGGDVERLTKLNAELEDAHFGPTSLPNGRGVLFTIRRWPDVRNEIAVLDLETREVRRLQAGVFAMYSESGHLIVVRSDGTLVATPFDPDRLELTGAPTAVGRAAGGEPASLALSSTGTLIYRSGLGERGLAVVNRRGERRWLGSNTAQARHPAVSPDGRWIAADLAGPNNIGIWIYDLYNGTFSPLTFDHDDIYPAFSADGRSVLFARAPVGNPGGAWVFHSVPADGSGDTQPYLGLDASQVEIIESRDGRWLIYRQGDLARAAGADLYYIDTAADSTPTAFAATRFEETSPALSPDGRWLAYVSDESGSWEVYVQPFPGGGAHHRISTDGGSEPQWSGDGHTLYYRSGDHLVAAAVAAIRVFRITRRDTLFPVSSLGVQPAHHAYTPLPGDSGFVFTALSERAQLVMVLDWFEELREGTGRSNTR